MSQSNSPRLRHRAPLPGSFIVPFLLVLLLAASGCAQQMRSQPKLNSLDPSDFFPNGSSAQQLVPDTVARGQVQDDPLLFTGKVNGADSTVFPYPITKQIMERGQSRFNIYCSPCHGETGQGNGLVVQRGFTAPPSFHSDRLRCSPVGHFFDVITNGFGAMPSYAPQIPVDDRWAIIAYIRALQYSQSAAYGDVPADQRGQLGAAPATPSGPTPNPCAALTPAAGATGTPAAGATGTPAAGTPAASPTGAPTP